jgi:hypothetical protein
MSLNGADIQFLQWAASLRKDVVVVVFQLTIAEFTTLKQTWQQSKADSYLAKAGETILPGFTGVYHK